jgi:hypothetical protein
MLQVVLDQEGYQLRLWIFVNFASYRISPLEAGCLLRVLISVVLNGFEDLSS